MFKRILGTTVLGGFFLTNVCFSADALIYGIVLKNDSYGASKNILKKLSENGTHSNKPIELKLFPTKADELRAVKENPELIKYVNIQHEVNAIQTALNKPVKLQMFSSYKDELSAVKKNPDSLTFMYIKEHFIPDATTIPHWNSVAQVLSLDPKTHRQSKTFSAYLLAAKKSKIHNLTDLSDKTFVYYNAESTSNYLAVKQLLADKKITGVHWIKANDFKEAYTMVESGKADVLGTWHQFFMSHQNINNFKVIYAIPDLANPVFFANTSELDSDEIKQVKAQLEQIGTKTDGKFTYE